MHGSLITPGLLICQIFVLIIRGTDYLGPLSVFPIFNPGEKMFKVWILLYTCASTRGVVLDVVDSMTSNTLIHSLRKFISRRGAPALIISDNGSSFTAQETQRFVANRQIKWMFNLELAPWWGGIWERLVSLVKSCRKKTIGCKRLSFMELVTIVQDIEFVLNNRPLCDTCDEDTVVLTPKLFIIRKKTGSYELFSVGGKAFPMKMENL